jgi:hypothetical protein
MKATISFNLDDPDDMISYNRCNASLEMAIALFNIRNELYSDEVDIEKIKDLVMSINLDKILQ